MPIYAVVPVKKLIESKKRLSKVLNPLERKQVTLGMLEDVLKTLKASNIDEIVVIGEDVLVEECAKKYCAFYLAANGATLNVAIEHAQSWCIEKGASSILALPADLPLIHVTDINRIIELGEGGGKAVVLAASKNWGTNALLQNPPKLIPACFGPKSWLKHIQEAYRKGVGVRLFFSEGVSLDIDSVSDLKRVFQTKKPTQTWIVLEKMKLSEKNCKKIK